MEELPDSGARTAFDTGAVRDSMKGKGFPSMIPTCAIMSMARRFEDGATKYGPDNWRKGIPLSRYCDAAYRHLMQCRDNDQTEDHFGAVLWNMSCWLWTKKQIEKGNLPKELNDILN
tara:strand:+ start:1383 stop:1733 length:351 start_codon:yes stop_codon:yes gene_type:complete